MDDAYRYLRGHVRHLHFVAQPDAEHISDADNRRTFELLAADGFTGSFSVEIINPDDPDAVLGHHMRKFEEFMEGVH
jgi:hypothetical protein